MDYEWTSDRGGHWLRLCGSDAMARQLKAALVDAGVVELQLEARERAKWTHVLETPSPPTPDVQGLLELLGEKLTLEVSGVVDFALALDFYKDPASNEDPQKWANTRAGELVYGKYLSDGVQRRRGKELADELAAMVRRHPVCMGSTIISVPGHDTTRWSFGEKIAAGVAERLEVPFLRTTARHAQRPEAKKHEEDIDLTDEFTVSEDLAFGPTLIVDDVYRTGTSMRAVAAAARRASATNVYAVVGARTMRN
jgi:hypothetical protein